MNKFAVAHVTESALLVPVQIDLEFRSVGFCARRTKGEHKEKPSSHSPPRFKPGPIKANYKLLQITSFILRSLSFEQWLSMSQMRKFNLIPRVSRFSKFEPIKESHQ